MDLWIAAAVSAALAWGVGGAHVKAEEVVVRFLVRMPKEEGGVRRQAYISGSTESLGSWRPDGLALQMGEEGEEFAEASIRAKHGERIEYKFTCGTWASVEKGADGSELGNRVLEVPEDRVVTRTEVTCVVARWGNRGAEEEGRAGAGEHTITGDVRVHRGFRSAILGNERDLFVWLPPGYGEDEGLRCGVFYLHDGQNVFDEARAFAGEWRADESAQILVNAKRIEPIIIVGISNAGVQRIDEYTSTSAALPGEKGGAPRGGLGLNYARFVAEEVKPFIDATYRTKAGRESTAVGGSSLGGLISLVIAQEYPDVFGACMAMSPSFRWDEGVIRRMYEEDSEGIRGTRFWIDAGSAEQGVGTKASAAYVQEMHEFASILEKAGMKYGRDYRFMAAEGGVHNEAAWADRFDDALLFLFGVSGEETVGAGPGE